MKKLTLNSHDEAKKLLSPFFAQNFHVFPPFHPDLLLFCEDFSKALFQLKEAKEYPDFVALAFWLRKGNILKLQETFQKKYRSDLLLVPRGLVFHIPPGNIDVMLVYSWICSLLVGNGNIIRIPGNRDPRFDKLLEVIFHLLSQAAHQPINAITSFVQYGHEEAITAYISTHIDLRVIWGGNETVSTIKKIPTQPHAKDIAFPDRFSYSAIHAQTYLDATPQEQEQTINHFFNDTYWFDQSACSSPRVLFWVGDSATIQKVSQSFYKALQETIKKRHYEVTLGGALLKRTYMYDRALSLPVDKILQLSNELGILYLEKPDEQCRVHCGQGLLYHIPLTTIEEIIPFVNQHDQTLTYYGFSKEALQQLILKLNGKGLNRIVPFGQALNFEPVWDGQDLFDEFTQHIKLHGASP